MPTVWRIVKRRYVDSAFDEEGARKFGGRWNSPGVPLVYAAGSRALGLLEVLAGLGSVRPLPRYVLISATFDDSLLLPISPDHLPSGWRKSPPTPSTQRIGDTWAEEGRSAVLQVPSAIIPEEHNYLLNPAHPDFRRIQIGRAEEITIDSRLLR